MNATRHFLAGLAFGALLATAPLAQDAQSGWGDLDALLLQSLGDGTGATEGAYWLPNAATPEQATQAIGVLYVPIQGAAGNFTIEIGLFRKAEDGFALADRIDGIYGTNPREVAYGEDSVQMTTTTLNPDDARCCPSGSTRWSVDLETLDVSEVD